MSSKKLSFKLGQEHDRGVIYSAGDNNNVSSNEGQILVGYSQICESSEINNNTPYFYPYKSIVKNNNFTPTKPLYDARMYLDLDSALRIPISSYFSDYSSKLWDLSTGTEFAIGNPMEAIYFKNGIPYKQNYLYEINEEITKDNQELTLIIPNASNIIWKDGMEIQVLFNNSNINGYKIRLSISDENNSKLTEFTGGMNYLVNDSTFPTWNYFIETWNEPILLKLTYYKNTITQRAVWIVKEHISYKENIQTFKDEMRFNNALTNSSGIIQQNNGLIINQNKIKGILSSRDLDDYINDYFLYDKNLGVFIIGDINNNSSFIINKNSIQIYDPANENYDLLLNPCAGNIIFGPKVTGSNYYASSITSDGIISGTMLEIGKTISTTGYIRLFIDDTNDIGIVRIGFKPGRGTDGKVGALQICSSTGRYAEFKTETFNSNNINITIPELSGNLVTAQQSDIEDVNNYYQIPFYTTNYKQIGTNDGLRVWYKEDETNNSLLSVLTLGNDNGENKEPKHGAVDIYSTDSSYQSLRACEDTSGGITYLRNHGQAGYLVATTTTSQVGNTNKPVYISNKGIVTALSDTKGATNKPVYLNSGTITACSGSYGANATHMYISNGSFVTSSATVGNENKPIYMKNGKFTECSGDVVNSDAQTFAGEKTFSSPIMSIYKSQRYVDAINNKSAFNINTNSGETNSYTGWISGPTNTGRIAISTYPHQNDELYFTYLSSSDIAADNNNPLSTAMKWNGASGQLTINGNILMSGNIMYTNNTYTDYAMIQFKEGANHGAGIVIGGGGCIVVGSGESANQTYNNYFTVGSTETVYITSDQQIYFLTGCDTFDNRKVITFETNGSITCDGVMLPEGGFRCHYWSEDSSYAPKLRGAVCGSNWDMNNNAPKVKGQIFFRFV